MPTVTSPIARLKQHRRRQSATENSKSSTRCKADSGVFVPMVDAKRCEGKGACAAVCPYDVFEIGRMSDEQFDAMPVLLKLKLWAHGRRTAFTPNADACHACGACVAACPERAITLVRADGHSLLE